MKKTITTIMLAAAMVGMAQADIRIDKGVVDADMHTVRERIVLSLTRDLHFTPTLDTEHQMMFVQKYENRHKARYFIVIAQFNLAEVEGGKTYVQLQFTKLLQYDHGFTPEERVTHLLTEFTVNEMMAYTGFIYRRLSK